MATKIFMWCVLCIWSDSNIHVPNWRKQITIPFKAQLHIKRGRMPPPYELKGPYMFLAREIDSNSLQSSIAQENSINTHCQPQSTYPSCVYNTLDPKCIHVFTKKWETAVSTSLLSRYTKLSRVKTTMLQRNNTIGNLYWMVLYQT